jgi:Acyl-coenzyme A synthetases/AMP-(fatty) acid ligases
MKFIRPSQISHYSSYILLGLLESLRVLFTLWVLILYGTTLTLNGFYDFSNGEKLLTTADLGWINGHSDSLYGVLLNYGTVIWYEGVLDYPSPDVMWEIIEKYKVEYVWTAPTLIKC